MILNHSRAHTTPWQTPHPSKNVDIDPLSNTQHFLATPVQNTIIKKEGNRKHLGKAQDQISEYKTQSYSTHLR